MNDEFYSKNIYKSTLNAKRLNLFSISNESTQRGNDYSLNINSFFYKC